MSHVREIHLSFRNSLLVKIGCWGRILIPIFSPTIRIIFIINLCFLTKNLELAENVVLLEVLYRHVDCVDIYDFIHLLIYYQLCINFQQQKTTWKWIVFKILWGFLCVYIKPKNTVHLIEEMPQSLELVPFFPIFLRVLCCFFLFNMKTTCYSIKEMIIIIIMLLTFIGCSTVFKPCSLIFSSYTIFWKWLLVTILLYIIYRVFLPWSL